MALNYEAINDENRRRYGTDIGRIGPMLLADRYDDQTHFIFELLQNAEDALGERGDSSGPRMDKFSVGRFGIGFNSAYPFIDRPDTLKSPQLSQSKV